MRLLKVEPYHLFLIQSRVSESLVLNTAELSVNIFHLKMIYL